MRVDWYQFQLARRNIFRHWRYSLGAVLAVLMGFLALTLFRCYMKDVAFMYEDTYSKRGMYGQVIIERNGTQAQRKASPWDYSLSEKDQNRIGEFLNQRPEVTNRVRFLVGTGMVSNGTTQAIFYAKGYDLPEGTRLRGEEWKWDVSTGVPLHQATSDRPILIGQGLAGVLDCELPDIGRVLAKYGGYLPVERPFQCPQKNLQLSVTTAEGQSNAQGALVTGTTNGIFKEIDDKYVVAPLPYVQRLFDTKSVSFMVAALKPGTAPRFVEDFNRHARESGLDAYAIRWQDHAEGDLYVRTMELLSIFRNFVVTILLVITGLSVFNTFLKAVKERSREIGTLRSFGFTEGGILILFGMEAGLLALVGVVLGVLSGFVLTVTINNLGILYKAGILAEPVPFRIAYAHWIYFTSTVFLLLTAVLAALVASYGTTRAKIADNLVHV